MEKSVIWSNIDLDIKDFAGEDEFDVLSEDEKYERMIDDNNSFLDDERINLDIQLDNPIIIIADLGLWNGRRCGYKIIKSGNIKDILYADGDHVEWYADEKNIRCTCYHHDGRNKYLYREIIDVDLIEELFHIIRNGYDITDVILDKYTKSIRQPVADVFGW